MIKPDMNLVIVSPFPPTITGVGQYGYHITRALAETGAFNRITVLAGESDSLEHPNHLGITEIEYCWKPGQLNVQRTILSRIKQLKPDLVWFNLRVSMFGTSSWLNAVGLSTPMFVRQMGFPTVVTLHELPELADLRALDAPGGWIAPFGARLLTALSTQADVLCLTLRHYTDWIASKYPEVECVYIPLGAYQEPTLLEEAAGTNLLLFTMLAPFKGVELLLETFPRLKQQYPELKLTIAGEEHPRFPGYAEKVKARFNGIQDVQWKGAIPDENLIDLFRPAKIVVLPYTASTGASSVLYQAATWGRPVVASNLSEIRTLAAEAGFKVDFFETGSKESLFQAISKLLDSPERRLAQTKNNFTIIQNTRLDVTCHRYVKAFNRALEKRSSPKRIPITQIPNIETA
jgi:glycosyltransferase involved in cell wall biosynthesis